MTGFPSADLNATRFLLYCRQGGDPAALNVELQQTQMAALAQEIDAVASVLTTEQTAFENQHRCALQRARTEDHLSAQESQLRTLESKGAELRETQEELKRLITEKKQALDSQVNQLHLTHTEILKAQTQAKQVPHRYANLIYTTGNIITTHIRDNR